MLNEYFWAGLLYDFCIRSSTRSSSGDVPGLCAGEWIIHELNNSLRVIFPLIYRQCNSDQNPSKNFLDD